MRTWTIVSTCLYWTYTDIVKGMSKETVRRTFWRKHPGTTRIISITKQ